MKRAITSILTASLMSLSVTAWAVEYPSMTIRAATANPAGSLHTEAINYFKEVVESESEGNIRVQTFYGGSMGDEQSNVRQLRTQEIHLAVLAVGNLTPFASKANIYYLPYLFPEIEDAYTLFEHEEFNASVSDQIAQQSGARPLSWLIGGYRHLTNSRRPIEKIDDLQGLRIRTPPVEVQLETFRAWGVEPLPLAWTETFSGLQQGVIDGQENPHSVNRDQKFWEVQSHVTELSYLLWVGPILVGEAWFQGLDDATKELITRAASEAALHVWEWSAEQEKLALEAALEQGMQLSEIQDEDVWQERARSIWPKFHEAVGGETLINEALEIMGQ